MERIGVLFIIAMFSLALVCSCGEEGKPPAKPADPGTQSGKAAALQITTSTPKGKETIIGYAGPIEKATLNNNNFRQVLYTGKHSQLVIMCLQPGEEIGKEMHADVDQFFRIEYGNGKFIFGEKKEHVVGDGDAVVVPAGTYHNVINMSSVEPLKLYSVYSPPIHPDGTVHKTKAEAEAAEHH